MVVCLRLFGEIARKGVFIKFQVLVHIRRRYSTILCVPQLAANICHASDRLCPSFRQIRPKAVPRHFLPLHLLSRDRQSSSKPAAWLVVANLCSIPSRTLGTPYLPDHRTHHLTPYGNSFRSWKSSSRFGKRLIVCQSNLLDRGRKLRAWQPAGPVWLSAFTLPFTLRYDVHSLVRSSAHQLG